MYSSSLSLNSTAQSKSSIKARSRVLHQWAWRFLVLEVLKLETCSAATEIGHYQRIISSTIKVADQSQVVKCTALHRHRPCKLRFGNRKNTLMGISRNLPFQVSGTLHFNQSMLRSSLPRSQQQAGTRFWCKICSFE